MLIQRGGFHPAHENVTAHCRRRFRLIATTNPTLPQPDTNLWIVHYSRTEPQHQQHVPGLSQHMQATIQQRQYLQRFGQLLRKEFMLLDRNNWPQINLPAQGAPYPQQRAGYPPGNVNMGRTQQPTYLDHQAVIDHAMGGSPAKRQRHNAPSRPGANTMAMTAMQHNVPEDDDGDIMDLLTPREVSTMRYVRHHEWMEEIFNSPYTTDQIEPVDLGLGRRGALESLTKGYFFAPIDTKNPSSEDQYVGRMEPEKAADFRKHAGAKIAEINTDIERIKHQHARRMAKFSAGNHSRNAERQLRNVPTSSSEMRSGTNQEQVTQTEDMDPTLASQHSEKIEQIGREVEVSVGRHIEAIHNYKCVQKGGLEEKPSTPYFLETDTVMAEASSMLHADAKPVDGHQSSRPPFSSSQPASNFNTTGNAHKDGVEVGDWVMVEKDGENGRREDPLPTTHRLDGNGIPEQDHTSDGPMPPTISAYPTTDEGLTESNFESTNFDDGIDFGDEEIRVNVEDTTEIEGDALLNFDVTTSGMDSSIQDELGLDESVFGDAFHASETQHSDSVEQPPTASS